MKRVYKALLSCPHVNDKAFVFWAFAMLAFASGWWPLGVLFVVVAAVIHLLRAK